MSLVRIQQRNTDSLWTNIKITSITTSDEEVVVLGPSFRILVDGDEVYRKGKRNEDLNQTPTPKVKT